MKFGRLFGENISFSESQRGRGDLFWATSWLNQLHPLLRKSARRDQVGKEAVRVFPLFLFLLLGFFALGIRLTYLTLFRGEEHFLSAEGNRIVSTPLYPERGLITDRNGEIIAGNRAGFRVVADPRVSLEDADLDFLAEAVGESRAALEQTLRQAKEAKFASVSIKAGITRDTVLKLEANAEKIPGISVETVPLRSYPYPYEFAHVLGFIGEIDPKELEANTGYVLGDWVGKSGLERFYEKHLRGLLGKRVLEKDAVGRVVRELARQAPKAGETLVTTLDLPLQRLCYQVLEKWIRESSSSAGAIVVSDVNTGEILSLVSYPSFDPDKVADFLESPAHPLLNRAISGIYPPGSTFKLVTGTAALEEGVVNASTVIWDRGSITVGPWVFYNWQRSGFGPLTFVDALSWSSDIYFYTVAGGYGSQPGVGEEKLAQWARRYGLGEITGIDLPSEAAGTIPDPDWKKRVKGEAWYLGDTYHMGIGQGDVLLTPLQLNMVTAIVANGGKLVRPHLVSSPANSSGLTEVASEETLALIRQGMRKSMTDGPNRFGNSTAVAIAGKTGTAEAPLGNPHSWFTAFAPYENPQIAVTVLIENGARLGAYHPSVKAAKEVMEYYFRDK